MHSVNACSLQNHFLSSDAYGTASRLARRRHTVCAGGRVVLCLTLSRVRDLRIA